MVCENEVSPIKTKAATRAAFIKQKIGFILVKCINELNTYFRQGELVGRSFAAVDAYKEEVDSRNQLVNHLVKLLIGFR